MEGLDDIQGSRGVDLLPCLHLLLPIGLNVRLYMCFRLVLYFSVTLYHSGFQRSWLWPIVRNDNGKGLDDIWGSRGVDLLPCLHLLLPMGLNVMLFHTVGVLSSIYSQPSLNICSHCSVSDHSQPSEDLFEGLNSVTSHCSLSSYAQKEWRSWDGRVYNTNLKHM